MKILVMSDIHLAKFDEKKYEFLKNIIKEHDKVIIIGDFWDSWHTTSKKFINSKYKKLFPLLLKKKTVYIFGNHDPSLKIPEDYLSRFCINHCNKYKLEVGNKIYYLEHGHGFSPEVHKRDIVIRVYALIINLETKWMHNLTNSLLKLGYKLFPKLVTDSRLTQRWNNIIKELKPQNKFYIIGHTHRAEVDKENQFANSGAIHYGYASYLTITENDITLKKVRY